MATNNVIITFLIYFVIIGMLIFGVLLLLKNIAFYVKTAHDGTPTAPKRKKRFLIEVVLSVVCIIIGGIGSKVLARNKLTANMDEVGSADEDYSEIYRQVVNNIEFEPQVINKEETLWEELLDDYLYYDYYKKWMGESVTKEALRKRYLSYFGEDGISSSVSFEDVVTLVNTFYETDIFPLTKHTLAEIDEKIPAIEERMEADPAIATEEFLLRIFNCTATSSDIELYQAGRAIDDAYKQKEHQKTITIKESILLSALAIALYDLSLQAQGSSKNRNYSFTLYKTAELVISLEDYSVFKWGRDDYSIHFLLFAEARLKCAENTYIANQIYNDIRKEQFFLSYYLAKTQYKLIGYCEPENDEALIEELTNECVKYCYDYINSPYTKEECVASCRDILYELER